jgi:hemoglobin/transferrin/lactoferrin receptor protein
LVYLPEDDMRMNINFSSGFRAPNIDDAVRIFESSSATKRVIIPNADIEPEYTYNAELGFSKRFNRVFNFEVTGFYTWFHNAITTAPFQLNGEDSIVYNGVVSAVYASQNVNRAYLYGLNVRARVDLNDKFSFDNTFSYTYGRFKNADGTKKPLDHIPPVFGKSSLAYGHKKLGLELYLMYNGWKRIDDYNPDGEDNGQYATADGMPCWMTLNWRGSYAFTKNISVQAGVENMLDRNYRYFASGFSAPGRNFIVALRTGF